MTFEHSTSAYYEHCITAIKKITFGCLPFTSCGFADEEEVNLAEECYTLTGYGTTPKEMGTLFPSRASGARLVISRPRKLRRKTWPSASNPSEVQAFCDKELSQSTSSRPIKSRPNVSRASTSSTVCMTPGPITPFTPPCPDLSTPPSSCDSSFDVLDTPTDEYPQLVGDNKANASQAISSRLPLPKTKTAPKLPRHSSSPKPRSKSPLPSLLAALSSVKFKKRTTAGTSAASKPAPISISSPAAFVDHIEVITDDAEMSSDDETVGFRTISSTSHPMSKSSGRIPRLVGAASSRLRPT